MEMLYAGLRAIDVDLRVEEVLSRGHANMAIFHVGQVFVMEFKVAEDESEIETAMKAAMAQIREHDYGDKYLDQGKSVHLIGLVFSQGQRHCSKFNPSESDIRNIQIHSKIVTSQFICSSAQIPV